MDEQSVRGMAGVGQVAARGLFATALTLSLVPSLAYASPENEEEAPSATNTEEASSQSETETASANDYTPVALSGLVGNASVNYDLSKIADGTYAGTAVADSNDPLNKGDEWNAEKYDVSVSVTVSGGKITKVEVANYDSLGDDDYDRMDRAVNGYTDRKNKVDYEGVVSQINTAGNTDKIDAVTTATISSNAIKAAVDNALQVAYDDQNKQAPETDEYTYGYAGLTWAEYWANEGVYNASDTSSDATLDSHNETDKGGFDVVSRATANHGPARGAFQCTSVFHTEEGTDIPVAYWQDGSTFVCPDGSTGTFAKKAISYQGASYTMSTYDLTGTRYVPVKVKTSDLDAFKAKYQFVANDETLYVGQIGSTAEGAMVPYTATANVTANTNGLKTVTNNDGSFQFSKAVTGSESGLKDQAQKSVDLSALSPKLRTATVPEGSKDATIGSFGEFMRLDFTGAGYGELGANMQSVTWTYYGNDSTYSTPLRTFGTKFAADNWMHSRMGIQLGLTESARCQLPENTDGTGYWKVTIHALGYADSSYTFQATSDNIKQEETPVTSETKQKLQDLYNKAAALNKDDYTAESWEASAIETERGEAKDLLAKENLGESEASEQITHLQAALDALVKAEKATPEAGSYVLMNIPYSQLYAADTTNNNTKVDVFSSATVSKSQTGRLSGGSYGGLSNVSADGKSTEITGAQFPVKVTQEAAEKLDWASFTKVTDETSQDVTTTNRGQTSTVTYTGKQALFCMGDYAYYQLSGEPAYYKELSVDAEGNIQLSEVKGAQPQQVRASAEFTTETTYGDYELDLDANTVEQYFNHESDFIYTVLINAEGTDGKTYSYGLRPLENVWLGSELAWCSTPLVSQVHGCPTSYQHYAGLMGQTIKSVTYYTEKGAYTFNIDDTYVPVKSVDASVKAQQEQNNIDSANAQVGLDISLPDGFDAEYSIEGWNGEVEFADAATKAASQKNLKVPAGTQPGQYTIVATDKNGKYAPVSGSFLLTTATQPAKFDSAANALVASQEGGNIDAYLKNISTVSVNGKSYAASGRGAVKVVNADGSINLAAASRDAKVFDGYGTFQVEVASTGYENNLSFQLTIEADKTQLRAAIAAVEQLSNNGDYSAESWNALQSALATAKAVADAPESGDEAVKQALDALTAAQNNLQAGPKANLQFVIDQANQLKQAEYTTATWSPFSQDLAYAQQLLNQAESQPGSVTDDKLNSANEALKASMDALVKKATAADMSALRDAIEAGKNLKQADYTVDSWAKYQTALKAANALVDNADASQAEVQQATAALTKAQQELAAAGGSGEGSGSGTGTGTGTGSGEGDGSGSGSGSDNGTGNQSADSASSQGASSDAPKTGDNALGFAGAFAAIAAAAAGVVAAARRRLMGK